MDVHAGGEVIGTGQVHFYSSSSFFALGIGGDGGLLFGVGGAGLGEEGRKGKLECHLQ